MLERRLPDVGAFDLKRTLKPIWAGAADPTMRVSESMLLKATRTPDGPATLGIEPDPAGGPIARAWGPGAEWLIERSPEWIGASDAPPAGFAERHPELARFEKGARGLRLARPRRIVEHLTVVVLQQLVTGKESKRAFKRLVRTCSEPAPGPFPELWLPVAAETLARVAPALFVPLGILPRMGETLRRVGMHAARLEAAAEMGFDEAVQRLRCVQGIGPWTAHSIALGSLGHPDAVPVGDYHLPSVVAYHLAGERDADDARMLELLEPYAGQRGRVLRWITMAGKGERPRRGPRTPVRELPEDSDRWLRGRRPA